MQAHNLNQSPGFTIALTTSSELGPKQRVSLEDIVRKLGQYYKPVQSLCWQQGVGNVEYFKKKSIWRDSRLVFLITSNNYPSRDLYFL